MLRYVEVYFNVASSYTKMMLEPVVRHARFKWLLLGIFSFVLATWLYFGHFLDDFRLSKISIINSTSNGNSQSNKNAVIESGLPWPAAPAELWKFLQPMLDGNAPGIEIPEPKAAFSSRYNPDDGDKELQDSITMSSKDVLRMRNLHQNFIDDMNSKLPNYFPTKGAYKRGIVAVAGGFHFPVFFVSLRMLRRTGSTLPVEVFLPSEDDYEEEICETILPQYNAKCITLTSVFKSGDGTHQAAKEISKYQYKIFSLLFSSFEEVLFLDSDSFPIENPDLLFDSEPFKQSGMITWPDIWATSASPLFYLISNQTPPKTSERATMESGQFLVSKKTHHKTLVLAAYYNYFGPNLYYYLLCQGGAGTGDKETFHPAALALGLPFYAVTQPVKGVGHAKNNPGEYYVFAMIQHDPLEDYERIMHGHGVEKARPFFVHANTPKWNAQHVLDISQPYTLTQNINGEPSAAFVVPEESLAEIPEVEKQMWEEVKWVGCELEHKFKDFREGTPGICGRLQDYYDRVLSHRYGLDREQQASNATQATPRVRRFVA